MSELFMLYNKKTERPVKQWSSIRTFATMQGAKTARAALVRNSKGISTKDDYEAMPLSYFRDHIDIMVETHNILNPAAGPIMIRKSELGGINDPGTESYHCC